MSRKRKPEYARKRDAAFRLAKRKKRIQREGPGTLEETELWLYHAMKVDLGFADYRQFYFNMLLSTIKDKDLDLTLGEKKALNEMLDRDRFCIETIEERIEGEPCRHSKSEKGALYRVSVKIPERGVVPKSRFFVKRCIDEDTWERSMLLEMHALQGVLEGKFVPQVKYSDRKTRLLAYELIEGQPLYEAFRTAARDEKEHMLMSSIEALFMLSEDVAPRNHNSYSHGGSKYHLRREGNNVEIELDNKIYALKALDDHKSSILRMFVIKGNAKLEDSLTSWDGKVSKEGIGQVMQKYKSVQPFLDAYSEISDALDSEQLCFSHGDFHLGNIIWTAEGPKFIDWEMAVMAARQFDLLKLLKKAGVSKEAEERLLWHAFMVYETAGLRNSIVQNRNNTITHLMPEGEWVEEKQSDVYRRELEAECKRMESSPEAHERFEKFRKAYRHLEFHENLISAAKYLNYSEKSETPNHQREMRGMANYYYTLALNYARGSGLEKRIKQVVEEVMDGRLIDLGDVLHLAANPLARMSMSNLGHTSIIGNLDRKEPRKKKVKRAVGIGSAVAAAALIGTFAATSELARRDSENFIRQIGSAPEYAGEIPHSQYVEKYASMYKINPKMLEAAVAYVHFNNENINLGAAGRYRHDPEQLTMSIAKRMHDLKKMHGEDYPLILAELYGARKEIEASTRWGIRGRYVDFRRMQTPYARKVADTMAMSGYYAKNHTMRAIARWRR